MFNNCEEIVMSEDLFGLFDTNFSENFHCIEDENNNVFKSFSANVTGMVLLYQCNYNII